MKTETYLYEILIRGTPDGNIAGAHVIYNDRYVSDTGEVLGERPSGAKPIDISKIQEILGTEMANALTQLPQAIADKEKAIADKTNAVDACSKALIDGLTALAQLK